jgi:two-component system response regulator NreC
MNIHVLIADDHKIVREGLCALLEKQEDIEVVSEAEDGHQVLRLVQETLPNVVVIDVAMPGLNGIEATRRIVGKYPNIKVIALSMYSDRRLVAGMLSAGASGYLLKDCAFEELAKAIRSVAAGQTYLSPMIVDIVVRSYFHNIEKTDSPIFSVLTNREREVLQLLAEGKTAKEIASYLCISVKTIETHRQQIMRKLNIHSIAELTKYAIREGLTSMEI